MIHLGTGWELLIIRTVKEVSSMKRCIACGMPMNKKEHYAMGDKNKDYCIYCMRPDGSMQSYEEKIESTADFIVKTQGIDKEAARLSAKDIMSKLPAWKNRK